MRSPACVGALLIFAWCRDAEAVGLRDSGSCPDGFYQEAPVVFPCSGSGGDVSSRYLALARRNSTAFRVPAGVRDFRLEMSVLGDGDVVFALREAASQRLLVAPGGKVLRGGLRCSGSGARPQCLALEGRAEASLELLVENRGFFPTAVAFRASFGEVAGCSGATAEGCRPFDPFAAQRAIVDWSAWALVTYGSVGKAWTELASSMTEMRQGAAVVPLYRWSYVWKAWPSADVKGAQWQEVFRYIAAGDDAVTKADFVRALDTAGGASAIDACFSQALWAHGGEADAWRYFSSGDRVARADEFARNCSHATGFPLERVHGLSSQVDGQRGFSRREFLSLWSRLRLCPAGEFRAENLVYACHEASGRADVAVSGGQRESLARLRKGMRDIEISVQSLHPLDLLLRREGSEEC